MTPLEKLNRLTQNKRNLYNQKIASISMHSPMAQVLAQMYKKRVIEIKGDSTLGPALLKKRLDFRQKEKIFKIQENWKKQPYISQRCLVCHLDIPGPQDIMIAHLNTHFNKRVDQIETHPYKYI